MSKIDPEVLKKLRAARGFSQGQLAERAKIDKQTISRVERGEQDKTRPHTIEQLARVLNVESAVLTGHAPIPVIAPAPQKSSFNIRLSRDADNALYLVAERYSVRAWQVMELAPLLFCWAAEMSLRQRRDRIRQLEQACENARDLEHEMPHLPVPNFTYSEEKIVAESESIDTHDIFGQCIDPDSFLDNSFSRYRNEGTQNPFAKFLAEQIGDLGDVATFEEFSSVDCPEYRVCPEEASRLVGGDEDRVRDIFEGRVALGEMPKKLQDSTITTAKERAEWVRAQAEEYHKELSELFDKQ